MKKVLITAFEPFNGQSLNASSKILNQLNTTQFKAQIHKLIMPTVFTEVNAIMTSKIDEFKPDIILLIGEAGQASHIRLERVAINIDDARIPDNRHNQPINLPININGETAYFSTLPIKTIHLDLLSQKIPAIISNSAGTFVCNHFMYVVLDYLTTKKASNIIAGFIHFPYIKAQIKNDNIPYLDIKSSVKALEIIKKNCINA
ncbi:pyroglutamyl-peptidase I [Mycoplasmatota bacterium]|nr:pyroglutamyl-peptidase I [Mycoplasmatota bacterium]